MMRIKFIEDKVAVLTENYFWNRRNERYCYTYS